CHPALPRQQALPKPLSPLGWALSHLVPWHISSETTRHTTTAWHAQTVQSFYNVTKHIITTVQNTHTHPKQTHVNTSISSQFPPLLHSPNKARQPLPLRFTSCFSATMVHL